MPPSPLRLEPRRLGAEFIAVELTAATGHKVGLLAPRILATAKQIGVFYRIEQYHGKSIFFPLLLILFQVAGN
jgi:hypothetical protein